MSISILSSSRTPLYTSNHAGGRTMGTSSVFVGVGIALPLVIIAIIVLIILKTRDEPTEECQESESASEASYIFEELRFEDEEIFLSGTNEDVKLKERSKSFEESNIFPFLFDS
jgi:hypothetical protein